MDNKMDNKKEIPNRKHANHCALFFICYRNAVGIQQDRLKREFPLCMEHKQFYDFLGEEKFIKKYDLWLFSEKAK